MARSHGKALRGLNAVGRSSTDRGRFGRMFRWLRPAYPIVSENDRQTLIAVMTALADAMNQNEFVARRNEGKPLDSGISETEPDDENSTISAGYTYLGQFIDHDITFDPVSTLDRINDPDALEDFRTPRLDLDSVYGRGPDDEPFLYAQNGRSDPIKLLTGADKKPPELSVARPDHQRNSEGVAIIGDPRNDENLLVGQIHNLFVRLHNKLVDDASVVPQLGDKARFVEAQRLTRWHYQWIVIHDFLVKIVGAKTVGEVLSYPPDQPFKTAFGTTRPRPEPSLKFYKPHSYAFMPIEFSVAAYRLGHSMVRPSYSLSVSVQRGSDPDFQRVAIFSGKSDVLANLNGFRVLPDQWGIDWSFFFPDLPTRGTDGFKVPQPSYRIDTQLVDPLASLPQFTGMPFASLAARNLVRALDLQLPSGQSVAEAMGAKVMSDDELWSGRENLKKVFDDNKSLLQGRAPLWFYILREAEMTKKDGVTDEKGGHHLGPVGGRIVAEVLIGLIWNDHQSYLYQAPLWKPSPPLSRPDGRFEMSDLIKYVDGGDPYVALPPSPAPYSG